jgi:hypothetical protein
MAEERKPVPGDAVVYHDEVGSPHSALCTTDWGMCINVLFVSADNAKTDQYGRQIERQSSVSHAKHAAHGRYWRWPDEVANQYKKPVSV